MKPRCGMKCGNEHGESKECKPSSPTFCMVPRKLLIAGELHQLVTRRVSEVFANDFLAHASGYQKRCKILGSRQVDLAAF
jgi:hypothetical protein